MSQNGEDLIRGSGHRLINKTALNSSHHNTTTSYLPSMLHHIAEYEYSIHSLKFNMSRVSAKHFHKHLLSAASCCSSSMAGLTFAVPLIFFFFVAAAAADDGSIDQRCATEASKLTECVGYASGEEATPTDQCCGSVSDVRGKDPTCLCLVIRRAHDGGSGGVSGLHLRLDRLLSLPKACALANSSVSYCPKLLNLSPTSPDYAIFTNASYANPASTLSATTNSTSRAAKTLSNSTTRLISAAAVAFFMAFQIRA